MSYKYLEVKISKEVMSIDDIDQTLLCPVCEFDCNHLEKVEKINGEDRYKAGWNGRGDLLKMNISGECGHNWELCVGFHKGNLMIFCRVEE